MHKDEMVEMESVVGEYRRDANSLDDIVDLVLRQNLPFSIVEAPEFRKATNTNFDRHTASSAITVIRGSMNGEMKAALSSASVISLTCDEWTDCSQTRFLGIRALTIGENEYNCYCLAHWPLEYDECCAQSLRKVIQSTLNFFDIQAKVEHVVTDTAKVMKKTVNLLEKQWMPCFAHVFNLMLEAILDKMKVYTDPILACARATAMSTKWPGLVEDHKYATLGSYSPTRWYSMHRVVQNALNLRDELDHFMTQQTKKGRESPAPVDATWKAAENLLPVLATFKNAVLELESDKLGTLSHVYEAMKMVRTVIGECFQEVLPPGVKIAPVDLPGKLPRKLLCPLNHFMESLKAGWEKALEYWDQYITGAIRKNILIAVMLNPGVCPEDSLNNDELASAIGYLNEEYDLIKLSEPEQPRPNRKPRQEVTREDLFGVRAQVDELAEYLKSQRTNQSDFDVAKWWFSNKERFPTLFRIAQHYLIIPATSASSERQFSKAKRLKPKKRWSIKPQFAARKSLVLWCLFPRIKTCWLGLWRREKKEDRTRGH
jgi:hypothetical protein